ncbi:MAG: 3'(2'),5'-bisphosphate nucleotidase CysQ [Rhizobiaceae bacterium]|nr:3'(2'),5'-bisphosphate nucleotidase CysQ [Rhizobiaceae bacterium]MCV0405577.1 3'(2'),5'-bisphosphate nucleotidase CysQ [Rhizobiaceae bacterium]
METSSAATGNDAEIVTLFERLALEAGRAILAVYGKDFAVEIKGDSSPVTEADRLAETIILAGLRARFPQIACVAEEEVAGGLVSAVAGDMFVLVDPLDGTREFVSRNPDFTVNIALVRGGVPVAGVVHAPARGVLWGGAGGRAWRLDDATGERRDIRVRPRPASPVILASRSHRTPETEEFLSRHKGCETRAVGSSLKFCMIAEGEADIYPRHGRTMEWDTAAGDAVLRAAGGMTRTLDGAPLTYGKCGGADGDWANPHFIASGAEGVGPIE